MLQRIKQWIYDKIAGSQFVYDISCDVAEDAGILTVNSDPTFKCGFEESDMPIPLGRRRRRRRRRSR